MHNRLPKLRFSRLRIRAQLLDQTLVDGAQEEMTMEVATIGRLRKPSYRHSLNNLRLQLRSSLTFHIMDPVMNISLLVS